MRGALRNSILALIIVLGVIAPFSVSPIDITAARAQGQLPSHAGICSKEEKEAGCWQIEVGGRSTGQPFCDCGGGDIDEVIDETRGDGRNPLGWVFSKVSQFVGTILLTVASWILWAAATFFNFVITKTVLEMAHFVDAITGIDLAWRVIRDFVNMVFIFILLYISIATILRIEEYGARRLLTRVVIIALLINFSLFFTNVVIDASNILSAEFVEGIEKIGAEEHDSSGSVTKFFTPGGIAGAYLGPLKVATFYGVDTESEAAGKVLGGNSPPILTIGLAGTVFLLVAAFVFFAGALLLTIRFIIFIILMITSPLAFAGMILPATQTYARQWWSNLAKYALFAPVYMALLLVTAIVVNDDGFKEVLFGKTIEGSTSQGFIGFITNDGATAAVVLNFAIVIGLMIASLVIAQQLGIRGAQALTQLGKRWAMKPLSGARKLVGHVGHMIDRGLAKGSQSQSRFRRGLAYASPTAWKKAWQLRQEDLDRDAFATAPGKVADTLYKYIRDPRKTLAGEPSPKDFELRAIQSEVLRGAQEILELNMSEEEMINKAHNATDTLDKMKFGMAIAATNRQDDFTDITFQKLMRGEKIPGMADSFTDPLTGKKVSIQDVADGKYSADKFQKLFYGAYLSEMGEDKKVGYASMMQEYGEKNSKITHFADTITVDGERIVNMGFGTLVPEVKELQRKEQEGTITDEERKRLAEVGKYVDAMEAQYKSRMERAGAKVLLNAGRAADTNYQYVGGELGERAAAAEGFAGEMYGDISGDGILIAGLEGATHAQQYSARQHELQERKLIALGFTGRDLAQDETSLRRAASRAAINPDIMEAVISGGKRTVEENYEIIKKIFRRAIERAEELSEQENIPKLEKYMQQWERKVTEERRKKGGGSSGGGGNPGGQAKNTTNPEAGSRPPGTDIDEEYNLRGDE